ncbi:MAG: type II secretion system protein GspM [Pseudomonadota bacterium]
MNKILQRWQGMAPREQWMAYGVGLVVLVVLYMLLIGDPLAKRLAAQTVAFNNAEASRLEAEAGFAALQARLAADPNLQYRNVLLAAASNRQALIEQIDQNTAALVTPDRMKALLQDLLRSQPGLRLVGLQSFSEAVRLPGSETPAAGAPPAVTPVTLYRHGVRLQLEGGYFDLLAYLQAIQGTEWHLNWESLDYRVGDAGPGRARIRLQLSTLSRQAGWVGV